MVCDVLNFAPKLVWLLGWPSSNLGSFWNSRCLATVIFLILKNFLGGALNIEPVCKKCGTYIRSTRALAKIKLGVTQILVA